MQLRSEAEIIASWTGDIACPAVSICCVTYNHEAYISETLDGFLAQQTDFPFEIIVGEDCSADGTLQIIKRYKEQYPRLIRIITSESNVGGQENWLRVLHAAKGEFIAYSDGDDIFVDPLRLQKNYEMMCVDPTLSFIFGPGEWRYEGHRKPDVKNRYSQREISRINLDWVLMKGGGFYPSSTSFFRTRMIRNLPEWFHLHSTGDYPLAILAILSGKIGYLDDVTVAYRVLANSMTHIRHESLECCKAAAEVQHRKGMEFIEAIYCAGIVDKKMKACLIDRKNYLFHSRLIDCGFRSKILTNLPKIKTSPKLRLRLLLKLVFRMIKPYV